MTPPLALFAKVRRVAVLKVLEGVLAHLEVGLAGVRRAVRVARDRVVRRLAVGVGHPAADLATDDVGVADRFQK